MDKSLHDTVTQCMLAVENDPIHHLRAAQRNKLVLAMDNNTAVSCLFLNAAIKALEKWRQAYGTDDTPFVLVERIKQYLSNGKGKDALLEAIREVHTYMDNRLGEGRFNAVYSGYATVMCGYEIVNKDFTVEDPDEWASDPEDWSSCLYASLALNDGSEDLRKIDKSKNKSFWTWFLTECLDLALKQELLPFSLNRVPPVEKKDIPARRQPGLFMEDRDMQEKMGAVLRHFRDMLAKEGWSRLKIENYTVGNSSSILGSYKTSEEDEWKTLDNTKMYLLGKAANAGPVFREIRKKMYDLSPREGAWYNMEIILGPDGAVSYDFVYDVKSPYFDKWVDRSVFAGDFAEFQRDEAYMPQWLEQIIAGV